MQDPLNGTFISFNSLEESWQLQTTDIHLRHPGLSFFFLLVVTKIPWGKVSVCQEGKADRAWGRSWDANLQLQQGLAGMHQLSDLC